MKFINIIAQIPNKIINLHQEHLIAAIICDIGMILAIAVSAPCIKEGVQRMICRKKLKKFEEPLFMQYFRNYGDDIFQETILDEIRQKYDFKMLKLVGIDCYMPNPDREKLIRTGLSIEEICKRVEYFLMSEKHCIVGRRHPIKSTPDTQSQNLHPMVFVFDSPFHTGGITVEKLGISGNLVDIFEPSTVLNKASLDVDECVFKIPFEEDDLQDFEYYQEPTNLLFQNLKYAISLFWCMQRELEKSNEDEYDEADIEELEKYSDTIRMYLEPKGIEADISETGWMFNYNNKYITLEEVIRTVYAGKLKPTKAKGRKTGTSTPPPSQPRPSTPGVAQNTPTIPREPILVFAPYAVDYIITQFIDSDFCFDEVLGVPDEVRKELTKYTAIGSWVDEKDPIMRYMEVCNNDITFYKILKSPAAMLSFKITEKEKYQRVHFSMIVAVNDEISTYMLNRPVPMHQLDDADYKRLEQSLLLRRQDIEDKYNLGNFQDYVERVKIAIPLKTSPETPTPPQSQPNPSTPTPSQQAPTPPPKAPTAHETSTPSNIYGYISSMPNDTLIQSIRDEYYHIKGTFDMAPAMGENGSFEFAGVLLIWKYFRENLRTNFREIGEFMIPLGAHIGCAYNCMSALEWSDILESIIKAHDLLPYDEFSHIYRYLKENFSNEIHEIEFNNGDGSMDIIERMDVYHDFTMVFNSFSDYSSTLNYFDRQGLNIRQDMPFRLDC